MAQKHHSNIRMWAVGTGLMVVAWLADSAVDVWFEGGTLPQQLLSPNSHETVIRLFFITWQLIFLLYIARLFRQREKLNRQLVSTQQQAELERNKALAVLEGLGDGISLQDPELRVLYQNPAHRAMIGDHIGEFCYEAYQGRDEVCPQCHLVESFRDGQVHIRETSTTIDGHEHHVEIVSTPLFDASGELIGGIESVRDINQRKQDEAKLRSLTHDLQQRTAQLETANSELEAFSFSLSHDLRSYLTRIDLASESLRELDSENLSQDSNFCLQSILDACTEMEELIAVMLTLGRATRQELKVQQVDLSEIAEDISLDLSMAETDRIIRFDVAPGLNAIGDKQLLQIAVRNLLSNASKYTREEAQALISFSAKQQDDEIVFAVSDNGRGFDMQEADKLFLPFSRLSGTETYPGFGIGLATVQRIIQRHGGRTWAEAAPGRGATFFFTLKDQKATPEAEEDPATESV